MYYHGSKTGDLKVLKPHISMHSKEYVYLTTNRVVALIYTVNAIERFYETNGYQKPDSFQPWYSYGFDEQKLPYLSEYYPNAIKETYLGKSGYIYVCKKPNKLENPTNIYCAFVTDEDVEVLEEIFIEDIYLEFLKYQEQGQLIIKNYNDNTLQYNNRIKEMILEDISKYDLINKPNDNYSVFLRAKFPDLFKHI